MTPAETRTSPLRIFLAWIVVLIPLGWGVYQSVVKSLPLFYQTPAWPPAMRGEGDPAAGGVPCGRSGIGRHVRRAQDGLLDVEVMGI